MSSSNPPEVADPRAAVTERLARRFADWWSQPVSLHLLAVLLLVLVAALRWWPNVFAPRPLNDEMIYFRAFGNTQRGLSPFDRSGYLSFSLLAHLGGWSLTHLGEGTTLALLRAANLTGLSTTAWCSTAWAPWTLRGRWIAAALFVSLAPAVGFGMVVGNLSLLVSGMIVLALIGWPSRPLSAGGLLGGSIIAKPLAPGAIVALLSYRPAERGRTHLLAGGSAAVLAALIALGSPDLGRAIALDPWPRLARSVSPHRIGHLLGLDWSPLWITAGVALLTVLIARHYRLGPTQLLGLAVTASVAMTPIVWSHTLLVTLPLQALALAVAVDAATRRRHAPEIFAVVLGIAAIQLSEGATNLYDQHLLIQWLGALPPMIAPWLLLAYLYRRTTTF